jgi:hypothetical protein
MAHSGAIQESYGYLVIARLDLIIPGNATIDDT